MRAGMSSSAQPGYYLRTLTGILRRSPMQPDLSIPSRRCRRDRANPDPGQLFYENAIMGIH